MSASLACTGEMSHIRAVLSSLEVARCEPSALKFSDVMRLIVVVNRSNWLPVTASQTQIVPWSVAPARKCPSGEYFTQRNPVRTIAPGAIPMGGGGPRLGERAD